MASRAVMECALWKFFWVLKQKRGPRIATIRAKAQLDSLEEIYESLVSLKVVLEWLEVMADPHVQAMQKKCRNDMAELAYHIEDLADSIMVQVGKAAIRKHQYMAIQKIDECIAKLRQWPPWYGSTSSSQSSVILPASDYEPWLPVPAMEVAVFGMDGTREKLVSLLLDGEEQLKAITIVGFAGSGKTSLAMALYRQIEGQFQCRATALVSGNPDMKKLLNHLVSQLHPKAPLQSQTTELQQLIDYVREYLQDKRYGTNSL
uniref:NB-ARC domain-containing protein n=1 Tax=Oryza punctata TaxID=4537 RepID=A0A0E0MHA3_ORYPU